MKKTYTETWTMNNEKLQKATVRLLIYNINKFSDHNTVEEVEEDMKEVKYTGLTAWDIVSGGDEALDIEMNTCEYTPMDENHEYLVLHFNDGTKATYRNSYVDMFIR